MLFDKQFHRLAHVRRRRKILLYNWDNQLHLVDKAYSTMPSLTGYQVYHYSTQHPENET